MNKLLRSRWGGWFLLAGLSLAVWGAATPSSSPPALNDPVAGQALAASVRNARPAAAAEFHGVLKIRQRGGQTARVPVVSQVVLGDKSWQAIYRATLTNASETLTVLHSPGAENEYRSTRRAATSSGPPSPAPLSGNQIWQPFAGSDFSLADLGLEFFHWPTQTLVLNEMRKNRACHVLESRPAVPNDYARVLSWVDVETGGLMMAEAYNAKNQRAKEFEVKRFKKVGEQWQLQEIEIRNLLNRSSTVLEFDMPEQ